ncbi:putative glycerophosphodiester phosphodiesterase, protein kinase RLK-Pelle-LRK10L-2 family [Helianthus annuus]|nr:putative glycerophosphodiester phosphodiesterase, protein kinase RLK-Pelle-LRK10L-2 family [Helianthus annuus]
MKKLKTTLFLSFFIFKHSFCLDPWFELCVPKDCGDGVNITYPFFIHGLQNSSCGYPGFHLTCSNKSPMLLLSGNNLKVKHMDPKTHSIRLENTGVSSSCPSSIIRNLTIDPNRFLIDKTTTNLLITRCENRRVGTDLEKYRIRSCQNSTEFVMVENHENMRRVRDGCGGGGDVVEMPVELGGGDAEVDGGNYKEVAERGFVMTWLAANCGVCEESGGRCGYNATAFEFRCFCADRPRRISCNPGIARQGNNWILKVGDGGFGTVYQGKLSDGRLVAVKVLHSFKASGKEFINEVASIGFCSDNHKRALIYEFMPNGSLDKFIHGHDPQKSSTRLEVMKLYEVALGIAHGLDYLHRGCNPRILHLDIKPPNILLDDDFCPKIADFGLAKLYPRNESIVSMLEARGTIGYIAPEVFNKSIGGVSHKSDVYSYGMLILEMVGGNKNVDVRVGSKSTSDSYFPNWIYNRLEKDECVFDGVSSVEENDYVKKMTIVGLWCIQTVPTQRPSIDEVIDMLEGSMEALDVPQKPSFPSYQAPVNACSTSQSEQESSGQQNSYEL